MTCSDPEGLSVKQFVNTFLQVGAELASGRPNDFPASLWGHFEKSAGTSPAAGINPSGYRRLQPKRCRNQSMRQSNIAKQMPTRPLDSRRSRLDRRSGEDRRKAYSLDYFLNGGLERRKGGERRKSGERRADWRRVDKWYSVYCGDE